MNIRNLAFCAVGALGFSVTSAIAATLHVDGSGRLTGASSVDVDGTLYDVEFVDGTCAQVFAQVPYGDCNASQFDFNNEADATAAAQALISQVFVDGSAGNFASNPETINGCSEQYVDIDRCNAHIPFADHSGPQSYWSANAIVYDGSTASNVVIGGHFPNANYANETYARFTLAAVPIPATLPLLIAALVGLAVMPRRRKAS